MGDFPPPGSAHPQQDKGTSQLDSCGSPAPSILFRAESLVQFPVTVTGISLNATVTEKSHSLLITILELVENTGNFSLMR